MRMPLAPERMALCCALRIARRKATRAPSCSAMPWATSCASVSGFLTSRMLSWICLPLIFSSSPRTRSASAPLRPMTMPGRAAYRKMVMRSLRRSISTELMPARSRFLTSQARILSSSPTSSEYCFSAYQRDL
ncbi:hypothetical protein MAJHIDBO_00001 [Propionibacterium freudenreichii subsp. shermanii]|nr:hypothetical protein MAJHIDBO_00001 [Propionibacterium freudenreichii subsp. shermanii]SPS07571.1 hypothetical protein MAJHIDBO_00001 [Propionibacterium freudenreichii subsp. shermanii]